MCLPIVQDVFVDLFQLDRLRFMLFSTVVEVCCFGDKTDPDEGVER
jgi:hypothetical protein